MRLTIIGLIAGIGMVMQGCKKDMISKDTITDSNSEVNKSATFKMEPTSGELLVRQWMEWVFTRDMSLDPNSDATGAKQYADQPFSTGIMMLAGANTEELVTRNITIDIDQYQKIFIPIMYILSWTNSCYTPTPSNGNVPFGNNNSLVSQALNGNRTVILKWDN